MNEDRNSKYKSSVLGWNARRDLISFSAYHKKAAPLARLSSRSVDPDSSVRGLPIYFDLVQTQSRCGSMAKGAME